LRAIATEHDAPHAVSLNRRFNPALRRALHWIETDAPGEGPTAGHVRFLRDGRYEPAFLYQTGIHAADTICSIFGRPSDVSTRHLQAGAETEVGSRCLATVSFDGDTAAQVTAVSDAGQRAEVYEVFGPGYAVSVDVGEPSLRVSRDGSTVARWTPPEGFPHYVRNGTLGETRTFLDAVRRGRGFEPTLSDVLPSVELAAALESGADHLDR
jgi:predicted dehydrogenase